MDWLDIVIVLIAFNTAWHGDTGRGGGHSAFFLEEGWGTVCEPASDRPEGCRTGCEVGNKSPIECLYRVLGLCKLLH